MMGFSLLALVIDPWNQSIGADDHEHSHKHVKSTEATPHTERQAGYPQEVSHFAMESYNQHYSGGFIGGGLGGRHGHERCANEGTWGWDYTPFRPMSSRIFLKWSHGRRYQGGTGSYATDGPKPLEHITETIHGHFGGD
jgi:hypothetical protein